MHLGILTAQTESTSCSFLQLSIYYYVNVVQAVVNKIQEEDGLDYTNEVTKIKEGKIVSKKKTPRFYSQ